MHPTPGRNKTSSDSSPDNQQTTSQEPLHGGVYIGMYILNFITFSIYEIVEINIVNYQKLYKIKFFEKE